MSAYNCSLSPPADWDDYVRMHPDSGAFHCAAAVQIACAAFGFLAHFVTVRGDDGRLRGVLQLVEQVLIPWTRSLVSLPFCTYGGPLADDDETLTSLIEGAEKIACERRALRIVLRHARPMPSIPHPVNLDKVSMVLPLAATSEALGKQLGAKLRSQIRRAERVNPEIRVGHAELLDDFYPVFCNVMRDLGTPVYPRRFFDVVLRSLGDHGSVVVLYVGNEPVSGAVLVGWRDSLEVPWAATLHRLKPMAINMRLYWELLQLAIVRGCRTFDFGRCSREAGTYRFKAQWGAEPVQLHWQTWTPGRLDQRVSADYGRSRMDTAVKVWSKLPLPLVNWLGPHISPRLPW
jgi:FemAB-related protein (PEP-CTERM system-associated)